MKDWEKILWISSIVFLITAIVTIVRSGQDFSVLGVTAWIELHSLLATAFCVVTGIILKFKGLRS